MATTTVSLILSLVNKVTPVAAGVTQSLNNIRTSVNNLNRAGIIDADKIGKGIAALRFEELQGAVKAFADTEQAIRRLETVAFSSSSIIDTQLNRALQQARTFSVQHRQSTVDLIDAMFELGTAGVSVEESLAGAAQAAFLSNAIMLDLTESARLMGTVFNTLGKTTSLALLDPFEKAQRASSALAQSIQIFAISGPQLAEGLKFAVGSASLLGVEIEDLTVALGLLNNAGLKGTNAGTALNQVFVQLDTAINKLNLDPDKFLTAEGTFKSISALLTEVQTKLSNLTPFDRFNKIIDGFNIRGARAVTALLPFAAQFDIFSKRIKDTGDGAKKLSDVFENSLETRLIRLNNQFNVTQQKVGEALAPALSGLISIIDPVVRGIGRFSETIGIAGTIATTLATIFTGLVFSISTGVTVFGAITGATTSFASSLGAVTLALRGPIGAFIGVASALTILFGSLGNTLTEAEKFESAMQGINDISFATIEDQVLRVANAMSSLRTEAVRTALSTQQVTKFTDNLSKASETISGRFATDFAEKGLAGGLSVVQIQKALGDATRLALAESKVSFKDIFTGEDVNIGFISQEDFDKIKGFAANIEVGRAAAEKLKIAFENIPVSLGGDALKNFLAPLRDEGTISEGLKLAEFLEGIPKAFEKEGDIARKVFGPIQVESQKALGDIGKNLKESLLQAETIITGGDYFDGLKQITFGLQGFRDSAQSIFDDLNNSTSFNALSNRFDRLIKSIFDNIQVFTDLQVSINKTANAQANLNVQAARFEEIRKKVSKGESGPEDVVNLETITQKATALQTQVVEGLKSSAANLETIIANAEGAGLEERAKNARELLIGIIKSIEDETRNLEVQKFIEGAFRGARGFEFLGNDLKKAVASALEVGFKEGAQAGSIKLGQGIGEFIQGQLTQQITSSIFKLGAIQTFFSNIEQNVKLFVANIQKDGVDIATELSFIKSRIEQESSKIKLGGNVDSSKVIGALIDLQNFAVDIFNKSNPGLNIKKGLDEASTSASKLKDLLVDVRAALLTEQNVRSRSLLSEAESLILNKSKLSPQGQQESIRAFIQKAQSVDSANPAIEILVNLFKEIEKGTINSSQAINSFKNQVGESASNAGDLRSSLDKSEAPVARLNNSFKEMAASLNEMPAKLNESLETINKMVDKLSSLKGSATVGVDQSSKKIDVRFGDFNVTVDGSDIDDPEELAEKITSDIKKTIDQKLLDLKKQIAELQRNR